jgi:uncharacterized membrane protein YhaH (DUF805 family)
MTYQYFINGITQHYADFKGRARRSEYWYFVLFNFIAIIIFVAITSLFISLLKSELVSVLIAVYYLGIIIPNLAVLVRRLHDVGKSGWFYFIAFIPIVGTIWLLVLLCRDSDYGPNEYGLNPKGFGNESSDEQVINSIGTSVQ